MLKYRTEDKDILLGESAEEIVRKMARLDHHNGGVEEFMERVRTRINSLSETEMTFATGEYEKFLHELVEVGRIEKLD